MKRILLSLLIFLPILGGKSISHATNRSLPSAPSAQLSNHPPPFNSLATNCTGTASFVVGSFNPPPLSIVGIPFQDTCTLSMGAIDITVSGGTPPYTFAWSNGATTEDVSGLLGGYNYWVNVMDANGDFAFQNYFVSNWLTYFWDFLGAFDWTHTGSTTCPPNPPNGSIVITNLSTIDDNLIDYQWATGDTVPYLYNICSNCGDFHVTVTAGTCYGEFFDISNPDTANVPILIAAPINPTCGQSNGSIDLTVDEGEPPFTIQWSNGANTEDLANLLPGTYHVTVTGANGCSEEASYMVADVVPYTLFGQATPNTGCGVPNGLVDIGIFPADNYSIAWNNGASTEDIADLDAGSYTVTVSDADGCTATATYIVAGEPSVPDLDTMPTPATCSQSNGAINLTYSGGASPYTFAWSNGATTEDLINVPSGSYAVTVTGANGCTATATATVPDDPVTINITGTTTPSTGNQPNGSVDITVSPPGSYTYAWSNGANTEDIGGLAAGTYSVTVSLGTSCTASASFVVEDIDPPLLSIVGIVTSDTCGLGSGAIDVEVNGGQPPYTFLWDNGASTEDLGNLTDGVYQVTATDANGFSAVTSFTVDFLDLLQFNSFWEIYVLDSLDNTNCTGAPNGGFDFTNLSAYDVAWSWSNGVTTEDNLGLAAGGYNLTVTLGTCINVGGFYVNESPLQPMLSATTTGAGCGGNNGSVDLAATGGAPPFQFEWSDAMGTFMASTEDLSGLGMGTYSVTVTGSNGCTSGTSAVVPNSGGEADTTAIFGTSCDLNDVGVFEQTLTNQNGCDSLIITTVTYSTSDTTALFDTSCDLNDVGIFEQLLVNSNGCDSLIITTIAYSAVDTTAIFDTSCDLNDVGIFEQLLTNNNGCDSLIITTIAYLVADTTAIFDASCDLNNVGVFEQTLTNANGCDSLIITTVTLLASDTTELFGTSCNPASVGIFVQNLTNANGCDSTIITSVAFSLSDTILLSATTCDQTSTGTFIQNLTTPEGCDSVVITTVTLLPADTTLLFDTSCDLANTGVFVQNLVNQNGCDSLVITTVGFLQSDTTLLVGNTCDPMAAGVFTQVFTNQFGCDSTVVETVSLLPSSLINLSSTTCDPTVAGVFTQVFTNQFGCDSTVVETVSLLPLDTTLLAFASCDPSQVGTSVAVFATPQGCDSVVVAVTSLLASPGLMVAATSDFGGYETSCTGNADGAATATAIGGSAPYSFQWSNGSTTSQLDNLLPGSYQVTVSDANGCTAIGEVSLIGPEPLVLQFTVTDLDCFEQGTGAVSVAADGGTPPYLYALNGGPFGDAAFFSGLPEGGYELTAQDANACEQSDFLFINAPVPVDVELGDDLFIGLGDQASLQAIVNLPFGSVDSVFWSPIDSSECPQCLTQPIAPLVTTTYMVTVIADNGCQDSDDQTVFVDRRGGVFVPNAFSPTGDGTNDVFMVFAKPGLVREIKSFLVFDRWGETVFRQHHFLPNDPAYGWDGTYKGQLMDAAVFAWFVELELVDGTFHLLEGDVTLVR